MSLKLRALYTVFALMLFVPAFAQAATVAEEEAAAMKEQLDDKLNALINAPGGVFDIEYGDDGALLRLKVKGEAEVPTSLTGARADRQARERAERSAKAAFSKFLSEDVVVASSDNEVITIKEKDGKESAEYLNVSASTINSFSNSFQRGLIVIFDHVEGEGVNRKAVIVLGWSQKLVEASMKAQGSMQRNPTQAKQESPARTGQQPGASGNTNTQTRTGNLSNF